MNGTISSFAEFHVGGEMSILNPLVSQNFHHESLKVKGNIQNHMKTSVWWRTIPAPLAEFSYR